MNKDEQIKSYLTSNKIATSELKEQMKEVAKALINDIENDTSNAFAKLIVLQEGLHKIERLENFKNGILYAKE
jgi:ethanolamine utilization protein EutA (predicted chaperonin)